MRLSTSCVVILIATLLPQLSWALRAVAGGQCASACGNTSSTTGKDIVCSDFDISNTNTGQAFTTCINCQMNSTAVDPGTGITDLHWMLYNLRFVMSSCLWGYNNFTSQTQGSPCTTDPACGTFESGMEFDSLSPTADTFAYCGSFQTDREVKCTTCLQQLGSEFYISNFFTAIVAGCQQKPGSGVLLGITGSLFSPTAVNITNTGTLPKATDASKPSGPLSLGAEIGIAIGAVLLLLIVVGASVICCGRRRRAAKLAARHRLRDSSYHSFGDFGCTSMIAIPPTPGFGGIDDSSPVTTAGGYGSEKNPFSPYSSLYNSPVSARDAIDSNAMWERHDLRSSSTRPSAAATAVAAGGGSSSSGGGIGGSRGMMEAMEMEKLRDKRIEERRFHEALRHNEFLQEAAQRGFTTSPVAVTFPPPPPPIQVRSPTGKVRPL